MCTNTTATTTNTNTNTNTTKTLTPTPTRNKNTKTNTADTITNTTTNKNGHFGCSMHYNYTIFIFMDIFIQYMRSFSYLFSISFPQRTFSHFDLFSSPDFNLQWAFTGCMHLLILGRFFSRPCQYPDEVYAGKHIHIRQSRVMSLVVIGNTFPLRTIWRKIQIKAFIPSSSRLHLVCRDQTNSLEANTEIDCESFSPHMCGSREITWGRFYQKLFWKRSKNKFLILVNNQ